MLNLRLLQEQRRMGIGVRLPGRHFGRTPDCEDVWQRRVHDVECAHEDLTRPAKRASQNP